MIRNILAQEKRPTRNNLEVNGACDNGHFKHVACLRSEEMFDSVCHNKRQYIIVYKHSDLLFSDRTTHFQIVSV
jgi:hypothetical protein